MKRLKMLTAEALDAVIVQFLLQIIAYEGSERNPVMSRVLLTHEIMCRCGGFKPSNIHCRVF